MNRRYLPLAVAAPLFTPLMFAATRAHDLPFGLPSDFVAGVIGGVGIGLSLVGLALMAGVRSRCA